MKVLVLGGTQFIGRVLVEKLLERKDIELTLFNRGKTNADLFPEVRKLHGDRRAGEVESILEENWDVIIDVSCYQPNPLENFIQQLKGKVGRYIFVSTVSVYPLDTRKSGLIDETMDMLPCSQEARDDENIMAHYGAKKVACEQVLLEADWLDAIIFRPSIVYGRFDHYDRHYYWLYRTQTQNEILLPEKGEEQFSFTYVEDLCDIMIQALTIEKHRKVYNVANPRQNLKQILDNMEQALDKKIKHIPVEMDWVEKNELTPHRDISLWTGVDMLNFSNEKIEKDFKVEWTNPQIAMNATARYYESLNWPLPKYGMSIEKEQALIKNISR